MPRLLRPTLLSLLLLAACQWGAGADGIGGAPAGLAAGEIEVTVLDGPARAEVEAVPAAEGQPAAQQEPAPVVVAPAVAAPAPKSAGQLACERRGGVFEAVGTSGARACVRRTRDAGKQCRKETDCEGQCLARSRSCAPMDPLFGCNEILTRDGTRMTLCIE